MRGVSLTVKVGTEFLGADKEGPDFGGVAQCGTVKN